jgi:hypothetical protein
MVITPACSTPARAPASGLQFVYFGNLFFKQEHQGTGIVHRQRQAAGHALLVAGRSGLHQHVYPQFDQAIGVSGRFEFLDFDVVGFHGDALAMGQRRAEAGLSGVFYFFLLLDAMAGAGRAGDD